MPSTWKVLVSYAVVAVVFGVSLLLAGRGIGVFWLVAAVGWIGVALYVRRRSGSAP